MPMKRLTAILMMIAALFLFTGCNNARQGDRGEEITKYGSGGPKKVGIVFGNPTPGSPAVRNAITKGAKQAADNLDVEYKILNPKDMVNNQEALRYFAENNYDMVIAEGDKIEKDLEAISAQYPDIKFTLFGGDVKQGNVQSVVFKDNEGAFLAGVEAALLSTTGTVGFLGGSETASHDLENGFAKGVQYINNTDGRNIKVLTTYAGVTAAAVNDQERGKTSATTLYWNNANVVFCGEGKLAAGAAQAAAENKRIMISADIQLMNANPWNVYGAIVEKQETVVYALIANSISDKSEGKALAYGVSAGAVDFVTSQAVAPEVTARLASVKNLIKQGSIKTEAVTLAKDLIIEINQLPVDMYNTNKQNGSNSQNKQGNQNNQNSQNNQNNQYNQSNQGNTPQNNQQPPGNTQNSNNQTENSPVNKPYEEKMPSMEPENDQQPVE